MWHFELIWEPHNRKRVILLSAALVLVIAAIDWWTKPYVSLGFLYLFPIVLVAGFLPRWTTGLLAFMCAGLSEVFSSLDPSQAPFRLAFETLALGGSGLFVAELVKNRRLALEAQERLRVLVCRDRASRTGCGRRVRPYTL